MMQKLIFNIAAMTLLLILGITNWVLAILVHYIWLSIIDFLAAVFLFYMAWRTYRIAIRIAEILDCRDAILITIASVSEGTPEAKEEEHEDIGHPV